MQVEATRLFRVKDIAELCSVHAATVYRAIESGALAAVKLGTGRGAIRVSGEAVNTWLAGCAVTVPESGAALVAGEVA